MAQSRSWCFTINNPELNPEPFLENVKSWPGLTYVVFQKELSDSGTPHYQGYLEFQRKKRLSVIRQLCPRGHFETRRGTTQQAIDYATKEDTRTAGPWTWGEPLQISQGKRSDLQAAIELLKTDGLDAVIDQHPATFIRYGRGLREYLLERSQPIRVEREVILAYGPPDAGKTSWFYNNEPIRGVLSPESGSWFDSARRRPAVLLDDFRGRSSGWSLDKVLRVLDSYSQEVPIKNSFTFWDAKRLYISTNLHPIFWYEYTNRPENWGALKRRFTKVLLWQRVGLQPIVMDVTHPEWEQFWRGPPGSPVLDLDSVYETQYNWINFNPQ